MSDKQDIKRKKIEEESANKGALSKQQLSVRAYLDQTVVPALLTGMTHMAKLRPEDQDPVAWLGQWLIDYSKNNKTTPLASPADKSASKQKADKPASASKEEKAEKSPKAEKQSLPATTTTTTTTTSSEREAMETPAEQPKMEVEEQKPAAAEEPSTSSAPSEEAAAQ